ncbi:hypothetical protein P7K49_022645 [Saguinus oedipus]|uniref:Uncharacterized protein n=1 Tax=Saguinus oedipus TaxID=9490 RepID=A0ABQ9UK67_SAGOE|nr:hypothetical protein P7K49_022645 [Saguinus oedipus]
MGCLAAVSSLLRAVLVAGAPKLEAFLSDEAVATVPSLLTPQYTLRHNLLSLGRVEALSQAWPAKKRRTQAEWTQLRPWPTHLPHNLRPRVSLDVREAATMELNKHCRTHA